MSVSRESRESEILFKRTVVKVMELNSCIWYGASLLENAEEHVKSIVKDLDKVIELMKEGK